MSDDGWTPVARSHIYCAPLCGRGCTRAEHDRAVANGRALAKTLGRGWRGVVWENLGWHFKATHDRAGVDVYSQGTNYWATTNDTSRARKYPIQIHATAKTPSDAVRSMLNQLGAVVKMHNDMARHVGVLQ